MTYEQYAKKYFGQLKGYTITDFKLEKEYWSILKPILIHFNYLPEVVRGIGKHGNINTVDIKLDSGIIEQLRKN